MSHTSSPHSKLVIGIGILAVSSLLMSGCGKDNDDAEFADATETASNLEPVAADLLTVPQEGDLGRIVSTNAAKTGDKGTIIVPSGKLSVTSVSTVEKVPKDVVDNGVSPEDSVASDETEPPTAEESAEATDEASAGEELGPAAGKALSLVTVSYEANDPNSDLAYSATDDPGSTEDLASPTLDLDLDGQTRELPKLDENGQRTYLMSIPADGTAEFVVTQDGHEQRLDLHSGEREDDAVASTYYRASTDPVEINEPLSFPDSTVKVGNKGSNKSDAEVKLTTDLAQAQLTPWTRDDGWAKEGTAWLIISGKADKDLDWTLSQSTAKFTYSLDPDSGDESSFEASVKGSPDNFEEVVAVPVETQTVSVTGSAKVDLKSDLEEIEGDNPLTVKTKQPYDIDFGEAPAGVEDSSGAPTEEADQGSAGSSTESSSNGSTDAPTDETGDAATPAATDSDD